MTRKWLSGGGVMLAAALFVAVNIVTGETLSSWRLDVTESRLFTLSTGSRNILQSLTEPVTLRFYFSAKLFSGIPALQNYGHRIRDLLEEYAAVSNGQLVLNVIDPEPFSEAEDQAVAYGITQLPISTTGDRGYLGLAGTNSTDDEQAIAFFQPEKEQSLEYELTKLIYALAHPKKRVIGVLSSLPLFGGAAQQESQWTLATMLREAFEIREIGQEALDIGADVDTLLLIHPKTLSEPMRYAIDQFVLKGGKAMVFVDPFAEEDRSAPLPENPGALPQIESNLPDLFEKWGLKLVAGKVAGDLESALRVSYNGPAGPQQIEYLPWLRLGRGHFNREDFVTNELKTIHVGSAGVLEKVAAAGTRFTPLISTGQRGALLEREMVMFNRDPAALLRSFTPGDKALTLAARISGKVKTAFLKGRPKKLETDASDAGFVAESKSPVNLIVVADTDLLSDRFWVQVQNFLGLRVPSAFADNANFVINALDNLGGNDDLISLRSRGEYARPFTRVEAIQREAEARFRDRERALQAKLEETERKIQELQSKKEEGSALLLSPEQKQAIEAFRDEQIATRKELRAVQHDLRKNIERLGDQLRFINIGLVPILIGLFGMGLGMVRARRHP
ncbi:MAG: Gldg family protein [Chromatiales bacterium]